MAGKQYVVTAPYVTFKVIVDGSEQIRGFYTGADVPPEVTEDSILHHLARGLIAEKDAPPEVVEEEQQQKAAEEQHKETLEGMPGGAATPPAGEVPPAAPPAAPAKPATAKPAASKAPASKST